MNRTFARVLLMAMAAALLRPPAVAQGKPSSVAPAVERVELANGTTLLIQPDPNVDTVAICCFVRTGVAEELGVTGLAALTARSLFGSNDNQSREAVSRDIYLAGGNLEATSESDYTLFTCVTNRATFKDAFYTLAQALKSAQFDRETVESARRSLENDAQSAGADPLLKAYDLARARLYADGPYRVPAVPGPETFTRVGDQAVQSYYLKRYAPGSTVISISGNVSIAEATRSAENNLIDYERRPARPVHWSSGDPPADPVRVQRKLPIRTRVLVAGFRGPGVCDPDYPSWLVLNAIVGGGKSSRLFRSVRDVAGIGYTVGSRTATFARDGNLMAVVEYDPMRAGVDGKPVDPADVEKLMLDSIRSAVFSPPSETEVVRARRFVTGKLALAHERVRDRAFFPGWYETVGAGHATDSELPKRVQAVSKEDVLRLARKWLRNEVLVVVEPDTASP